MGGRGTMNTTERQELIEELKEKARQIRYDMIEMMDVANSGHPGGAMSCADIVAALYFYKMRVDPKNPDWPDRDRLVISKGHSAPIFYVTLARKGFFPREVLLSYRAAGSILQGHPCMRKTPGVDMTTGSLGQGLSPAVGMALGGRLDKKTYRVFAILGDGEVQEGQIWEAAMAAAHHKLANLVAIIDYNGLQFDAAIADEMEIAPLADKWRAFGWYTIEIDGNDMAAVVDALDEADRITGQPVAIVAHTIKGKGVPFMENKVEWHSIADKSRLKEALAILESSR